MMSFWAAVSILCASVSMMCAWYAIHLVQTLCR